MTENGAQALHELADLVAEKDAALRELRHRARNNLQVTLSLLGLYGRRAQHPETKAILDSAELPR